MFKYWYEYCKFFNLDYPGPGSYRAPSEFGYYKAQDKYIKESERIDQLRQQNISKIKSGNLIVQHNSAQSKLAPIDKNKNTWKL